MYASRPPRPNGRSGLLVVVACVVVVASAVLTAAACTAGNPRSTATGVGSPAAISSAVSAVAPTAAISDDTVNSGPRNSSRPARTQPQTTASRAGSCVTGRCYSLGAVRRLPAGVAPESSGIVASAKSAGVFFVVDDGTGTDRIEVVRSDGSLVGAVMVSDMSSGNAEALAAGPCGDVSGRCFYVGDIGDNGAKRRHITVYRLAEPSLSPLPAGPVAADAWDYSYPDGLHNAEAMVVATDGSLLVITKSPNPTTGIVPPHRIYRGAPGGGELRLVSTFTPQNPAKRVQSLFTGTVVTDASYTPGRMLLLTYDEVIEYVAPSTRSDPATFPSWPHHELPAPPMIQSEGITADVSGCGYEVTSEEGPGGNQAGLAAVSCRPE